MAIRLVGWDDARVPPFVLRALEAARLSVEIVDGTAEMPASKRIVVFYRSPTDVLRASMARGASPTEAVALWSRSTRNLLDRSRESPERATLAPLALGGGAPAALLAALGEALGYSLADPSLFEEGPSTNASDTDILFDILAREALADPAARRLCAELEAASLRLETTEAVGLASLERAWRRVHATGGAPQAQDRTNPAAARVREAESRRANALLKAQVLFLEDELEQWRRGEGMQAAARLGASPVPAADMASYQAMLREGLQPLRKALEARDRACEALERQVAEVREQGRSAAAELSAASAQRKNLETKLLMASSRLMAQEIAAARAGAPSDATAPHVNADSCVS